MTLIITHSKDNDGHFSGAICQYFEETLYNHEVMYLRWSYGDKNPDFMELQGFDKIYILDLTLDPKVMEFLAKDYRGSVVWIDHHVANYEKLPEWIHNCIPGTRNGSKAACILTWEWWLNFLDSDSTKDLFKYNTHIYDAFPALELDESVIFSIDPDWQNNRVFYPYWLYFAGCYDIWKWNGTELWDKYIIPHEYYLRSSVDGPSGALQVIKSYFSCMESDSIPDIPGYIHIGELVYRYQEKRNRATAANLYKVSVTNDTTGNKVNCLVINTLERGSKVFDSVSQDLRNWADYFILWNCSGKKYRYSAYSEKPDVFVPDLKIKGEAFGGHPHAGGVVCNKKLI